MSELRLIAPHLPTALGTDDIYWLSDADLLLQFSVETGFLLEGTIDLERFTTALEEALATFPLFCGRFIRSQDKYGVKLTNQPIQVEVRYEDDCQYLPQDSVIQDPWLYSPPLDMDAIRAGEEEPLLKMRVTFFNTAPAMTVIGATSAHLVGDGTFMVKFWRLLSQNYQSHPPLDPHPTYTRATIDTGLLSGTKAEDLYHLFPQLLARKPQPPSFAHRVTLFFTSEELFLFQKRIQNGFIELGLCEGLSLRPSIQDCVTALVAVACSDISSDNGATQEPVTAISNVLNVRGGVLPLDEPVNALIWANATTASPFDVTRTAFAVRQSFIKYREPSFQAACLLAVKKLWKQRADGGEKVDFTPQPGNLVLNSSWRFDYTTAHFGFGTEKTHFLHTIAKIPRYCKMFKRNPRLPLDRKGVVQTKQSIDGAEFTFYLLPEQRASFLQSLQRHWKLLGMETEVEVMPRVGNYWRISTVIQQEYN